MQRNREDRTRVVVVFELNQGGKQNSHLEVAETAAGVCGHMERKEMEGELRKWNLVKSVIKGIRNGGVMEGVMK